MSVGIAAKSLSAGRLQELGKGVCMPDVVDVSYWNRLVSEFKDLADKSGAAFDLKRFPNGKERVVVELWFRPQGKDGLHEKNNRNIS